MAVTLQITAVTESGGVYTVEFSDGTATTFGSLAELQAYGSEYDDPARLGNAVLMSFLVRWWIARNATANNPNVVVGKTMTLDLSAADALKMQ